MKKQNAVEQMSTLRTPAWIADRWYQNVESVRRAIRQGRMESLVIGRRRLVPLEEILRIENEARILRNN